MSLHVSRWSQGLAHWREGDTAFISITFTWLLDTAYVEALKLRAFGLKVRVGGPALFLAKMGHELASLDGVQVGGDYPDAIAKHNPLATVASRGCPGEGTEDDPKPCPWCIVPPMEGTRFTLIPDFPVRPVLCDNNLSALPPEYQDYIISRYQAEGVELLDANSGFEPRTFTPEVYERWKPLVNAGGGPWRFAYDHTRERDAVLAVMRMLANERPRRKRVYVMIGNEPFEDCMRRIQEVIDHGCEPHVQPEIKLASLDHRPWVKDSLGWEREAERRGIRLTPRHKSLTPGEHLLKSVARWANGWAWKKATFDEYDPSMHTGRQRTVYDQQQGLFVEAFA